MSGVPQGSVLGPILFLIYINDLDDDITSKVLKFADDTQVFRKIKSDADRQHLQDDLNKLIEWSEKWQMLFNFGKCKCLHTGHGNEDAQYTMGDTVLNTTLKEKDLGLTINADMKVSEQRRCLREPSTYLLRGISCDYGDQLFSPTKKIYKLFLSTGDQL